METLTTPSLVVEIDANIVWVTLARVDRTKVLDPGLANEFRRICSVIRQNDQARLMVLSWAGQQFSAPTVSAVGKITPETLDQSRIATTIAALEIPVIAAVDGDAVGQGMELLLACDIRLCSENSRFSLPHATAGLIPWDGGTQRLPRVVGLSRGLELLLTGREISAQEATEIGLIHLITPGNQLHDRTQQLATSIAEHGPIATRYLKEAVFQGMDLNANSGLKLEADLNILLQGTYDRQEGLHAFFQRRRPQFHGR